MLHEFRYRDGVTKQLQDFDERIKQFDPAATRARVKAARAQRARDEYMARRAHISMAIFWSVIGLLQIAIVVMVVLLATA